MKPPRNSALLLSFVLVLLCVAIPVKVFAHAVLLESRPVTGSVIKGPVLSLWLRFNVRVDGSRSRCTLILPDGNIKALSLDPQSKPDVLTTNAKQLSAGNYKLQWQVLAADGHITRGELKLNVEGTAARGALGAATSRDLFLHLGCSTRTNVSSPDSAGRKHCVHFSRAQTIAPLH